ncbi:ribbon-helix-helix domain-containing protein [Ensifer soli]|uniref:ribbon-helix-helix domain-containing protein n=1 Tax=Ciceribacter sp. sgz301302 TaxID=3342379 RepID=UPI0035B97969
MKINRSVRIAGHSTSIRLERAFWEVLEDIASREGLSTPKLIAALYDEALEQHGGMPNLASLLRTVCLLYRDGTPQQLRPG